MADGPSELEARSAQARLTVLHLAPHPDDEIVGAGATLLELRDAGHRVVNLACGLGRRPDHERRRAELEDACARAGFELVVHDPPLEITATDDLDAARRSLAAGVLELVQQLDVSILVSPTPHDGHHGHEVVGRAARDALRQMRARLPRWWLWGLWSDLPLPTLVTPYDGARMEQVLSVLGAHRGEVARNDYLALVRARATANRVLGAEKAFGTGTRGLDAEFADLLTEAVPAPDGSWHAATPRFLDPSDPLGEPEAVAPIDWWLDATSFRDRLRAEAEGSP